MGMQVGSKGGPKSDINVTPLVDVVLVLLIIFMVIQPMSQLGKEVQTPKKLDTPVPIVQSDQIILRMDKDGTYYINKQSYSAADFPARLIETMKNRESKVVFFAADGDAPYEKVAQFLEVCYRNGAQNLGIVFDDL